MKKPVFLAAAVLLLAACETAPVRREDYIAQHPEWKPQMVELIRAGMIAKGMTKEQVRAAWGRHCYTCQGTTKGDWGESREFRTQVVFFDPDGRVTRWEPK
ncbi:hypothetical protein [Methylohalobius crimeensis]|uniref:hypothetical protein n=1 Tax=Methylohalobius crimeensis TaxID=244365 RepID=UPI0003B6D837|nr:hypothetical protein [Methylohalobius crimeensis]